MKNKAKNLGGFSSERLRTHLLLAFFSVVGCGVAYLYEQAALLSDIIALGTAYVTLFLLVATLAIGPLNLMLKRRNAVNLDLRRDVGIWAGIAGCIHVFFSLQLYNKGDIISYFFNKQASGYSLQLSLFTVSNLIGLLATIILLALLLLSNNLSLRWLKGKTWKYIQRFNYPLFILVVAHTIGYLVLNQRDSFFIFLLAAAVFFTVEAQLTGVVLTVVRERKRAAAIKAAQTPAQVVVQSSPAELEQNLIARRRFLVLSGVTIVTGVSSIVALSATIAAQNQSNATSLTLPADVTTPNVSGSSNPTNAVSSTASSNSGGGTILADLTSLPVGACITFTTPDTSETAFLIHEQDGSIKAFSNICTHRPYEMTYEQDQQAFYCPLHAATFDVTTGQVTGGPARYGLKSFKVQVGSDGKITYIQA